MKTLIADIVSLTLAKLSESEPLIEETNEYGGPEFDVRRLIEALMEEDALRVIRETPMEEIGEWLPLTGTLRRREGMSLMELPSDFGRFLYLRMSDWSSPETRLARPGDDVAGLRRLWARRGEGRHKSCPGLVLAPAAGGYALEIYGTCAGSRVAEGGYLPRPVTDGEGGLRFPPSLSGPLADRLARHVEAVRSLDL